MRMDPTYKTWQMMKQRCHNSRAPDYVRYGGRGITVCDRWYRSFAAFLSDMGARPDGHTLDRVDTSKAYEPGNCRWATPTEQARNRRNNKLDSTMVAAIRAACAAGQTQASVARAHGVHPSMVSRIARHQYWR